MLISGTPPSAGWGALEEAFRSQFDRPFTCEMHLAALVYFLGGPYNGDSRRLKHLPEEYFPPSVDVPRPPDATYRRATPPQTILIAGQHAILYVYWEEPRRLNPRPSD